MKKDDLYAVIAAFVLVVIVFALVYGMSLYVAGPFSKGSGYYGISSKNFNEQITANRNYLDALRVLEKVANEYASGKKIEHLSKNASISSNRSYPVYSILIPLNGIPEKWVIQDASALNPALGFLRVNFSMDLPGCQARAKSGQCLGYAFSKKNNWLNNRYMSMNDSWFPFLSKEKISNDRLRVSLNTVAVAAWEIRKRLRKVSHVVLPLMNKKSLFQQRGVTFAQINQELPRPLYPRSWPDTGKRFHFRFGKYENVYLCENIENNALLRQLKSQTNSGYIIGNAFCMGGS